jgi:hypothetical protein
LKNINHQPATIFFPKKIVFLFFFFFKSFFKKLDGFYWVNFFYVSFIF